MGAVQRLATVVIVGLVALSTILVLYLADEGNRSKAEEAEQQAAAIERGQANYLSLCLSCHGPGGQGFTTPGEAGTGRIGAPISMEMYRTGVNASGTPVVSGGAEGMAARISNAIHNGIPDGKGGFRMPPWGEANGGPLNDSQIEELVVFIQHADWNEVYNAAIAASGGYPTAPPAATSAATETPTAAPGDGGSAAYHVEMKDIAFVETELTVPANSTVTIKLTNTGGAVHNFNIDELNVHSGDYAPGQTGEVTFSTGAPGEYTYYCSIPGHREAGMVGKLIVSADATSAPAAAAPAESPAASGDTGSAGGAGAATTVDVKAQDIKFDKTEITIAANTDVAINVTNEGAATHNFSITNTDFKTKDLASGESETLTVNLPPGEYEFDCTIPGHKEAGMVGKLIVQ